MTDSKSLAKLRDEQAKRYYDIIKAKYDAFQTEKEKSSFYRGILNQLNQRLKFQVTFENKWLLDVLNLLQMKIADKELSKPMSDFDNIKVYMSYQQKKEEQQTKVDASVRQKNINELDDFMRVLFPEFAPNIGMPSASGSQPKSPPPPPPAQVHSRSNLYVSPSASFLETRNNNVERFYNLIKSKFDALKGKRTDQKKFMSDILTELKSYITEHTNDNPRNEWEFSFIFLLSKELEFSSYEVEDILRPYDSSHKKYYQSFNYKYEPKTIEEGHTAETQALVKSLDFLKKVVNTAAQGFFIDSQESPQKTFQKSSIKTIEAFISQEAQRRNKNKSYAINPSSKFKEAKLIKLKKALEKLGEGDDADYVTFNSILQNLRVEIEESRVLRRKDKDDLHNIIGAIAVKGYVLTNPEKDPFIMHEVASYRKDLQRIEEKLAKRKNRFGFFSANKKVANRDPDVVAIESILVKYDNYLSNNSMPKFEGSQYQWQISEAVYNKVTELSNAEKKPELQSFLRNIQKKLPVYTPPDHGIEPEIR